MIAAGAIASVLGAFFFLAGAVGLLRFPDFYTRVHAPTKAASLGLMFLAIGSSLISAQRGQDAWLEDLLLIVVVFLTVPVGSQMLIRGAVARGVPEHPGTQGAAPGSELEPSDADATQPRLGSP
jgi:multicomponent K+:H+ antiporter subunit G